MGKHYCDTEIRKDAWAMSGERQPGDPWVCSCGAVYVHACDEADGCAWEPVLLHDRLTMPDIGIKKP